MIKNSLFIITILLFLSCAKKTELNKTYSCNTSTFKNLETVADVKNLFFIELPKTWKTNLFYDTVQSSIFTADTTKQLTESLLLDITYINKSITFDTAFKLKEEQNSLAKNLIQYKAKEIELLNNKSYYTVSKGIKQNYNYQVLNIFIKLNTSNFLIAKAEIYGDSLVTNRMCEAIALIEKIKINKI